MQKSFFGSLFVIFLSFSCSIGFATTPSWQNFVVYVEGVKTRAEADAISQAIAAADPTMVKSVEGLTPTSGHVFIHHDHHNTRLHKLVAAGLRVSPGCTFYVKVEIPDYQKVQGTLIGDKLQELLDDTTNGIRCVPVDKSRGLFNFVFQENLGKGRAGFNMGDMAHPISDPIAFNGLGLNMTYIGVDGKGGMVKDPIAKEIQFLKSGKTPKPFPEELMAAYKKLFTYPTPELKAFYQAHPDLMKAGKS